MAAAKGSVMTENSNPTEPERIQTSSDLGVDETLGGYVSHHNRPPGFEGSDGHPYTVSLEVEKTPNLAAPFSAYLVFPRWAETGVGIVGHLETPILLEKSGRDSAEKALGALTLLEVQELLEDAIRHEQNETE